MSTIIKVTTPIAITAIAVYMFFKKVIYTDAIYLGRWELLKSILNTAWIRLYIKTKEYFASERSKYDKPKNLEDINTPILIVSSTYGQGDVPDGSKNFYNNLKSSKISLENVKYAVFGLGDMTYKDTFAYGGKKFDHLFLELNANRIGEPFYHDASDGSLPEEEAVNWFKEKIFKRL